MASFLGGYKSNYKDVFFIEENNLSKIYSAFNTKEKRECCLKVINKKVLLQSDYDFHIEQLKKEEEITKLCKSEYIVNFYQRLETEENIIFELESCGFDDDNNLQKYLMNNGNLKGEKKFFKQIVLSIAEALKVIHSKGVIHRDIKPNNIFLKEENNKKLIKLGDFGCSIFKKDNISDPIGTIIYSAPEIINNIEYDEKCDLWSLGITLYELYFGNLPYGLKVTTNSIIKAISNPEKFIFQKSKIPTLDVLFKRLLTINPKERMTYEEFFQLVFNEEFMKEDKNISNIKYKELYKKILKEENVDFRKKTKTIDEKNDPKLRQKRNVDRILSFVQEGHLPDIMNFANGSTTSEQKYNNIIYYDENIDFLSSINKDSDYFERNTPGAFILCTNIISLNLVKSEILRQIKKDKRFSFNLITTGSQCEKIMSFLKDNENLEKNIKNICIYCNYIDKYLHLKDKYKKIHEDIYNKQEDVINFIKKFSSSEIRPYPLTKLVTYQDYVEKYKERHFTVSKFYGNLTLENYKKYIKQMRNLIHEDEKENKLFGVGEETVFEGFLSFNLEKDLETLDKVIIKEYTKNTFYGDLNKWLMNSKMNFYEPIAYFTSRLMYSLNNYAQENNLYFSQNDKILYRGIKLPYTVLLPYERAKGKVILLSAFTSTSEDKSFAENWAGRSQAIQLYNTNLKFSVVFNIKNKFHKNWISNGINVQNESEYDEQEILFQPFSFYYVENVKINLKNYTADIYLETIGKLEILEEKIKMEKNICYNKKDNIVYCN